MNNIHNKLGHSLEDITPATGKAEGLKIIGTFQVFKACALGEAKKLG